MCHEPRRGGTSNEEIIKALDKITRNIRVYILPTLYKFADYTFLKTLSIQDFETMVMQLRYIKWEDFLNYIETK